MCELVGSARENKFLISNFRRVLKVVCFLLPFPYNTPTLPSD